MPVAHSHIWARRTANKTNAIIVEVKFIVPEGGGKMYAAAFTPARIVVTRNDIIFYGEAIQYLFGQHQLRICAQFGNVAGYDHKCHIFQLVYIPHRSAQVFLCRTIRRTNVRITDMYKTKWFNLCVTCKSTQQ